MERTMLKKWILVLVIFFLYFNVGTQGMDENLLENSEGLNNGLTAEDYHVAWEALWREKCQLQSAIDNVPFGIHLYNEVEDDNEQLKKDKYVLIQMKELPSVDTFIKTMLFFATVNPKDINQFCDEEFWTNQLIKDEIAHIIKKTEETDELEKMKDEDLWKHENLEKIIPLIPNVFEINIIIYDKFRKKKRTCKCTYDDPAKTYPTICIIQNSNDTLNEFHHVREVNDLKKEFFDSDIDWDHINFSPLHYDEDMTEDMKNSLDYKTLSSAINSYDPDRDYREKTPKLRKEREEITKEMKNLDYARYKDLYFDPDRYKYLDFPPEKSYVLQRIFDMYVGKKTDWKKLDNTRFEKIYENCPKVNDEKISPEDLINFFYVRYHDLEMKHRDIMEITTKNQWGVIKMCLISLCFEVIPLCCLWKSTTTPPHGQYYNIKLDMPPLILFSLWSIYTLAIFQYKNPFIQHDIDRVNEIEILKHEGLQRMNSKRVTNKMSWFCDEIIKIKTLRALMMKAWHKIHGYMEGKNFGQCLLLVFIMDQIGNLFMNMAIYLTGLYEVIPPPVRFQYFIHKELVVVKVITFVFFGQTQGFHIPNISQITSAGEFWEEEFCRFLFIKTLVIYSMIPSAVTAKLMKITCVAFGTLFGRFRLLDPISNTFVKLFHTVYDNKLECHEFLWNNKIRVISKLTLTCIVHALKQVFTDEKIKDDMGEITGIFGLIFIFDIVKALRNLNYHEITAISAENNRNLENPKRHDYYLNSFQIVWMVFGIIIISSGFPYFYNNYPAFGEFPENDRLSNFMIIYFESLFECAQTFFSMWFFSAVIDGIIVFLKWIYSCLDNKNQSYLKSFKGTKYIWSPITDKIKIKSITDCVKKKRIKIKVKSSPPKPKIELGNKEI